jgi:hypothetical protein
MQQALRNNLVCDKICTKDTSNSRYIENPYGNQPTAAIASMAGTYAITAFTITDDTLAVTEQITYGEHIYGFEKTMTQQNIAAARLDEMSYAVAAGIDKWVLNKITDMATGTYSTPTGGFTTAANIGVIISNLCSKVMGFADTYKGLFLVIENTDVPGFIQAQIASGFSYADAALNNGFMASFAGVDIYVVRTSTFVTDTLGNLSAVNDGHRLFGVKNVSTFAVNDIDYGEKGVTLKTGMEVYVSADIGARVWYTKTDLLVDITLA